ncbi:MAG: DUF1592 domain-containing protein [Acidobacteria bacterium]|nr:DUF1592 domain-containing protein [Acidobacteriota bacterium]
MRCLPAFGLALASIPTALLAQNAAAPPPSAVVKMHCASCHSGPVPKGGVLLDSADADQPFKDPDAWERVVRQLRARTMPTAGAPRPDHQTYESTIAALTASLDRTRLARDVSLTDTELAKRLSGMLWNGEPDQPLRDAAAQGTLRDIEARRTLVRRMLADSRSAALVTEFFNTWLALDELTTLKVDRDRFPEFDDDLRGAMRRETELFVESQLRDNRSPLDLWTADYTFLNERLARHYGIAGVSGADYRRVTWPGTERAGLLGQGSILALTSYPFDAYPVDMPTTSPAQRGRWILTRLMGVNPPTPIPGMPSADYPFRKHIPSVTLSKALPAAPCGACHQAFFPLSYGLEHFDVLGRWRANYGTDAIDASGTLVDGTTFNGPVELRQRLLERPDAFLTALTEKLVAYAIGGKLAMAEPTPASRMPAIRAVLREAENGNLSWSSLIAAIASMPADLQ